MLLSLWSGFWDWGGDVPVDVVTTGGISPHDAKRYREYLERLTGINSGQKITPQVIEAAQAITEIPVPAKQVSQIAFETPKIDFTQLAIELANIQNYINRMELAAIQAQRFLREQDDEMALMLLI